MAGVSKYDDTFIVHNTGSNQIKKPEYISELHRFKTKCAQCKTTVQRVRRLLDEINTIMENEIIGVCEHCKSAISLYKTCKRCKFIVNEFKSTHENTRKKRQQRFQLQAMVDGKCVCKHALDKDIELERISHALKEPPNMKELDIDSFSNLDQDKLMSLQNLSENKEMLEEFFSTIEFEGDKCVLSRESPSSSEEMCLCKYLKETSGSSSKKKEDSVLTWGPLKDFSRTLRQEGHENLMTRLLDLSKALPRDSHLNGELLKEIVETINTALKQELPQKVVLQLIKKITELNKIITQDFFEDLNTQAVIDDLNESLLLGSCKYLNHDLVKFFVDLSNLLTQEIYKGLNKEGLRDKNKIPKNLSLDCSNAVTQKLANLNKALTAGVLDKNKLQELSSDIHKAIGRMTPNELNEMIKELTNLNKLAVQGKSKTVNLELLQGLINDASKALATGLTTDKNKKMVRASVYNLNKSLTSDKVQVQNRSAGLTKNISKDVSKVLRSKYSTGKTIINAAGHVEYLNKKKSDLEAGIAKKETKSGKSASKKLLASLDKKGRKIGLDKVDKRDIERSLDKTWRRKGLDRADKRDKRQNLFQDKETESSKKKVTKLNGIKEKENLPPIRVLKNQPKHKPKELQQEARELSEYLRIKKQEQEEKFKFKKHRQLAKQAEKEMTKNKRIKEKDVTTQNNLIQQLSSRDEKASDQRTEITIYGKPPLQFDNKELEIQGEDSESTSPSASRTSKCQESFKNGLIRYQLSNKEFIRKGWTVIPKEKIMRRMNVYKMEPAKSQNCWFDRHKENGVLFYDSGQKLADIDSNGRGRWYYRNGNIALDYYNAEESNIGQRYVVYSSGTEMDGGKIRPRTVLALFDVLGNCVVYDLRGNVRLKYNQSEGVLVDPKIGPPSKWKWHNLNDPPDLQRILVETYLEERDSKLELLKKTSVIGDESEAEINQPTNSELVAIELYNVIKDKTFKLKQKFRPFKIREKTVKLNEQFSLKIIDQATIYLLYRDGITNLKLSLGMLLKSNEIIDTVISDVRDVPTPYDVRPAKSESVENIQKILKSVRSG